MCKGIQMRTHSKFLGRFVCLAVLTILVGACSGGDGGGGGNGDGVTPPPPPPPPPSSTSVTGTAAKGLLGNAIVNFYSVSANGTVSSTALATTRTNGQGVFSSSVSATGPVVVTVTADAQSTMLDELSGTPVPAPAGLTMRAVVAGLTTTPMAVTPLTEMAFGIASASSGGLTVANVDAANSLVSAAMLDGAPVLATLPVGLANYRTATVAQQAQAKLMTALAVAANEGFATSASGTPCGAGDYNARLVCMLEGLSSLVTPGASNSATFATRAAYLVTAYEKLNRGLVTVMGGQSPAALGMDLQTTAERALMAALSSQTALFGYNPSASPLANTKALFADLRTNIVQQQAGEDIFGLSPTLTALEADFETNVAPVLSNTRAVLVAAYTAAALIDAAVPGIYEWASGHVVCGYDPGPLQTAPDVALCRYGDEYDEQILLTATRGSAGNYSITTQPLTFTPWVGGDPGDYDPIFNPYNGGTFAASATIGPLAATFTRTSTATGALSAALQGPYYVTFGGGQVTADLDAAQSDDWNPATISGTLRVGGSLTGGAGGIALTEATIGSDSEIVVQNGAMLEGVAPSLYGALSVSRLATSAYVYALRASIGQPVPDASGTLAVPRNVAVDGSISQIGAGGATTPLFNGHIELATQGIAAFDATQPIGPANSFGAQFQVVGDLALPNGRVLAVSLAASGSQVEPTPGAPYSLSATYAYSTPAGVARINVSGAYDAIDGYRATVTTNSGVTAVLDRPIDGNVHGTVTANGVATATIQGTTINYSDGSTESIY
jgi:hypothetical protein